MLRSTGAFLSYQRRITIVKQRVNTLPINISSKLPFLQHTTCVFWHSNTHLGLQMNKSSKPHPKETKRSLETLHFDNKALELLPIDPNKENIPRKVSNACFSLVHPTPVDNPTLVMSSPSALALIDLHEDQINREDFPEYFSGNKILPGATPAAHCYCGHQFGYFSGQLGDGATMYLGEVINSKGDRWEIQFKGAGKTPYSRTADGRKVLRSSLREFLCSEAMHALGIPTTRAVSCVTSDTRIARDIFYTGDVIEERATVIMRMAPSFIRFGSFEITKSKDAQTGRTGPSAGNETILKQLVHYTIQQLYPEIWCVEHENLEDKYMAWFLEVVKRTGKMVAAWQAVGWCHGVLNTDNMSILGLTIDYGPFGWMDAYDPNYTCNKSDDSSRYSYKNQPDMCAWNCMKLAEALAPILPLERSKPITHDHFYHHFNEHYDNLMRVKLGLQHPAYKEEDKQLVAELLDVMEDTQADYTNTMRSFVMCPIPKEEGYSSTPEYVDNILPLLLANTSSMKEARQRAKPRIPENHLLKLVSLIQHQPHLVHMLKMNPKTLEQEVERLHKYRQLAHVSEEEKNITDTALWTQWIRKYGERLFKEREGRERERREEEEEEEEEEEDNNIEEYRRIMMNAANPKFVLRNYIAQNAIAKAEELDFEETTRVYRVLSTPYEEQEDVDSIYKYSQKPPPWSLGLEVT